jgi:hypothetical protein
MQRLKKQTGGGFQDREKTTAGIVFIPSSLPEIQFGPPRYSSSSVLPVSSF